MVRTYAEPNSWSHDDPNDPLSHHLVTIEDPLADEWYDCFVLVNRRVLKDTLALAIVANNQPIWAAIHKLFGKVHKLEEAVSEVDDALAEVDRETDEIKADILKILDDAKGLDKATAAKIRARVDALDAVGKLVEPSTEPPADGEPVVKNDPQTGSTVGGDPIPVSNFPAVENPSDGSSGLVVDNSPVTG